MRERTDMTAYRALLFCLAIINHRNAQHPSPMSCCTVFVTCLQSHFGLSYDVILWNKHSETELAAERIWSSSRRNNNSPQPSGGARRSTVGAEMYNSCWFINTLNNSANYLYHCFIIKYFYLVSKWYVCVLIKRC